jgi:hypothetical protein
MQTTNLTLQVHCGIPVVEVRGLLVPDVVNQTCTMLTRLFQAGHLDVILSLQHAVADTVEPIRSLLPVAAEARRRHGRMELVAGGDLGSIFASLDRTSSIHVSANENDAVRRLKRLPSNSVWSDSSSWSRATGSNSAYLA